ncbi:hypothetical protein T492DRAFT_1051639, partial [Pavlovales sp. CCMP2436]
MILLFAALFGRVINHGNAILSTEPGTRLEVCVNAMRKGPDGWYGARAEASVLYRLPVINGVPGGVHVRFSSSYTEAKFASADTRPMPPQTPDGWHTTVRVGMCVEVHHEGVHWAGVARREAETDMHSMDVNASSQGLWTCGTAGSSATDGCV